jgi:hypothetical protein
MYVCMYVCMYASNDILASYRVNGSIWIDGFVDLNAIKYLCMYVCMYERCRCLMYVCMDVESSLHLVPDDAVVDVHVAAGHVEAVCVEGLQVQQLSNRAFIPI